MSKKISRSWAVCLRGKSSFALAATLVGALGLVGCDNNNNDDDGPTSRTVVYAIRGDAELVKFGAQTPANVTSVGTIASIATSAGERVVGLDFRPADGKLHAVTNNGRSLTLDPATSLATVIQPITGTGTTLTSARFGLDFNPAANALRIVGDDGLNLRIPTAALVSPAPATPVNALVDGRMGYAQGVSAAAYTNSDDDPSLTTTALFVISTTTDTVYTQDANVGRLTTVGALGVDASGANGYDIFLRSGVNEHYALLTVGGATRLYSINATTGAATAIGAPLPAGTYRGLIVEDDDLDGTPNLRNAIVLRESGTSYSADFYLVDTVAQTVTANAAEPSVPIGPLPAGEQLVGFDVRTTSMEPNKDTGYALGRSGTIYALDGNATVAIPITGATLSGTDFGVDFNPRADLLRIVSDTGQNLRVNLQAGRVISGEARAAGFAFVDGTTRLVSPAPQIVATAYRAAPLNGTFQYALDARDSSLYRVSVPNDGALVRVGPLGVTLPANAAGAPDQSLDISGASDDTVLAALRLTGQAQSTLYRINLDTGAATAVGAIGTAGPINAITSRVE